MKYSTLVENIRYIKKVLKTPYHFFTVSNTNKDLIILILESKDGFYSRKRFTGDSIVSAVKEAFLYVENEIKNGTLKDVNEKDEKKKQENTEEKIEKIEKTKEDKSKK